MVARPLRADGRTLPWLTKPAVPALVFASRFLDT